MTARRPWIAYVGPVAFPEGGAAAQAILGRAQAMVGAGYDVTIVSGQIPGATGSVFELAPGVTCVSVGERNAEHLPRALRYARYLTMGARSRRWLSAQPAPPAAVVLYSGYSPYLLQFTGWARRRAIPFVFDAVEWYLAPGRLGLIASPYHWNIELAMRVLIPRLDGVIAISRALERYYLGRGLPVVRLPVITDVQALHAETRPHRTGPLRLAYTGNPGTNKDQLDVVVRAAGAVDGGSGRLVLDIAGLTSDELARRPGLGGHVPPCARAYGMLPRNKAVDMVANADFTVLVREINRVSTHGFPTKFVESLGVGTPVIANLTGDLADHLHHGRTGLICDGADEAALVRQLEAALAITPEAHAKMRLAARAEAERAFDFRAHCAALGAFLDTLRRRAGGGDNRRATGGGPGHGSRHASGDASRALERGREHH